MKLPIRIILVAHLVKELCRRKHGHDVKVISNDFESCICKSCIRLCSQLRNTSHIQQRVGRKAVISDRK
jgi:hypothetical protein